MPHFGEFADRFRFLTGTASAGVLQRRSSYLYVNLFIIVCRNFRAWNHEGHYHASEHSALGDYAIKNRAMSLRSLSLGLRVVYRRLQVHFWGRLWGDLSVIVRGVRCLDADEDHSPRPSMQLQGR